MNKQFPFSGLIALIVEDEKLNAIVAKKTLERWGIESDLATNGLMAVEMSQKRRYDFILMDIQMPEMDGLTATKVIRSDKENINNDTLIWALTAYATDDTRKESIKAGMDYFLTKPLDIDILYRLINRNCMELVAINQSTKS